MRHIGPHFQADQAHTAAFSQVLTTLFNTGDAWLIAQALDTTGRMALAAHAAERADSDSFIAWSLLLLGRAKLVWGDAEGAKPLLEESLVHSRNLDVRELEVDALVALGWLALATSDMSAAW